MIEPKAKSRISRSPSPLLERGCPYEEGTPEAIAWMDGYRSAFYKAATALDQITSVFNSEAGDEPQ